MTRKTLYDDDLAPNAPHTTRSGLSAKAEARSHDWDGGLTLNVTSQNLGWTNCYAALIVAGAGQQDCVACDEFQIGMCLDSQTTVWRRLEGKTQRAAMKYGAFNIVPPGVAPTLGIESRIQTLMICFKRQFVARIAREQGVSPDLSIDFDNSFNLNDPLALASAQGILAALIGGQKQDAQSADLHAEGFVLRMCRLFSPPNSDNNHPVRAVCNIPAKLSGIPDYVSEHLHESISIRDLSAVSGHGSRQFSRLFQETFGVSPYQYIRKFRVHRARQLIENTDRTIGEISFDCGFSDQSYFTKIFRKYTGCNPSDLRR